VEPGQAAAVREAISGSVRRDQKEELTRSDHRPGMNTVYSPSRPLFALGRYIVSLGDSVITGNFCLTVGLYDWLTSSVCLVTMARV
jgi:hypothetical protein